MDKLEAMKKILWLRDVFSNRGNENVLLYAINRVLHAESLGESIEAIVSEIGSFAKAIDFVEGVGPM